MSLADYLAKNYLTADSTSEKKSKKRKRKAPSSATEGLIIADDDAVGWPSAAGTNEDEDAPMTGTDWVAVSNRSISADSLQVYGQTAEFRKSKKNNWKTIGSTAPSNAEQAAADAIIASAATENTALQAQNEEAPEVVDEEGVLKMESGAHAGLQTAEEVTAALKRREEEERRQFEAAGDFASGKSQETIYRDASGRIINVAMKRAEARRKAEEDEKKKAAELEARKGDVQRVEKERRKQQLEEAKYLTVARYADDLELNEELREKDRWNDPAANFLAKKKAGKSVTGKPLYKGAAPPNRYAIRPGYRWDGVDRSNGFEKEYFAAQNRRKNVADLQYAWQMDE